MGGKQDKRQEPGKGREGQQHQRPGDPAHPRPGKSREQGQKQGQKEPSRRREDDLMREEDLHDETL